MTKRLWLLIPVVTLAAIVALLAPSAGAVSPNVNKREADQLFLGSTYTHGKVAVPALVASIVDNPADGGTVPATYTLAPKTGSVQLSCADTDGCTITLSETGAEDGTLVYITNTSANACAFADTSGVTETASSFSMGQFDSLTLIYAADRWVEVARSNN